MQSGQTITISTIEANCACSVSGFTLNSSTTPISCEACDVLNCHSCATNKTQCEIGGCRLNFTRVSSTECSCTASGFRLNNLTSPPSCEPCDVLNCHDCSADKTQCATGGCRPNFTRVSSTQCECNMIGFGLNPLAAPVTCELCQVPNCHDCSTNSAQCETGACKPNFTQVSSTECSCVTSGFRLNSSTSPHSCEECDVLNCHHCSADKTLCDIGGCRHNFSRVDPNTCECQISNGFFLDTASSPQ